MGINEFIKIGDRIKLIRKNLNLTQEDMANKLNIPRSTYANYETNKREPNSDIIYRICDIFDTSPYDLIGDNTLIEDHTDGKLKNNSVITDMFLNDNSNFFNKPSELREQEKWFAQQNALYKSFTSFITSEELKIELNYNDDDVLDEILGLYQFTLEMLYLKITEIKYNKSKDSK